MKIILGTMNFGPQLDLDSSREMISEFLRSGNKELDTAYVYNNGDTERYLGAILPELPSDSYSIATKVHPRITGKLDRATVLMELEESLRRMGRDSVDLLYFHFPDRDTPIDDALHTVAELREKGVVKSFGLSNYPAWQVVDICHICEKYGYAKPVVYQGMYNALCRNVEPELLPAIREMGMSFYAFNPLAGGLLSGKQLDFDKAPEPGRFARLKSYRERYWKKSYFDALGEIKKACDEENIPMAEAAYRWLCHHSQLSEVNDALILGASRIEQMNQNISAVGKGVLPDSIVHKFDEAWEIARPDSPAYFKFI